MAHWLGIDMGGTATRWVVVDAAGKVKDRGSATGATGHLFNREARERFTHVIENIAKGVARTVDGAHLGVTGLGPRAYEDAQSIIGKAFGCNATLVSASDDMELAFRAAFAPGEGHLISAGTGSVGLHIAAEGSMIRVGGRGILIDDGGSGSWIALRAIDEIYRRIDETGTPAEADILASALFKAMGGDTWDDTRAYVYGHDRGGIGALARIVGEAAHEGDPLALEILTAAARELARLGTALVARGGRLPIGFVGGVLALHPVIQASLRDAFSDTDVRFPTIDAAFAAAEIARKRNETTP